MSELRKEIEEMLTTNEVTFFPRRKEFDGKIYYTLDRESANRLATAIEELFEQKIKSLRKVKWMYNDYNMDIPNLETQNILWEAIEEALGRIG